MSIKAPDDLKLEEKCDTDWILLLLFPLSAFQTSKTKTCFCVPVTLTTRFIFSAANM